MGPKKVDNTNKTHRASQASLNITVDPENHHCTGKFAADLELYCRESPSTYPINIPVYIRSHPPSSSTQQLGTNSGASIAPSLIAGEEYVPSSMKLPSGGRIPSHSQTGTLTGIDNDNKSVSILGYESLKSSSSSYKTFHVVSNSDFYRPKLLVDSIGNENESIDQIKALYMRAWQLDQRFIGILKKILPLQEQLHTLNFCFVGLNEQTIYEFAEVCQLIKNLKTVSLDGNPLAAEYFHILIEKFDSKIVHLSLRFCKITDTGAERLANALGNMSSQNWKLLTLTLTGNQIGDNGAKSFANALRYNRTLISLNLSSNFITDVGACTLALVLRKIVLTQEEIVRRRYLLSERFGEINGNELRIYALSPTPSTTSTKSRSARDAKRILETNKNRKTISTKSTEKRHRIGSGEDNHSPSTSKSDQKKGKNENTNARSTSNNSDQPRISTATRAKRTTSTASSSSKKNILNVKEDEDIIEKVHSSAGSSSGKLPTVLGQRIERENPLLEKNENQLNNGEINLKGNYVLLNLNLSRNYLTLETVHEFLLSIQYQTTVTHFNETNMASLIDFTGLCRLELKGMSDISKTSAVYQSLEALLLKKNPSYRLQQIKEQETKEFLEQQPVQIVPEKIRASSTVRSANQRPTSRIKDTN
ncbi:unnamed protein product [Adineta steineri]|uniref:Uncharacterized protein n=1 Tax=Adineta steineri TaxID=433720 RepID=A0A814HBY2_9BILA|nr:unnamed protein product [Adineta steineri]CAF3679785.1 unnamed protein product [Adineta steineri]